MPRHIFFYPGLRFVGLQVYPAKNELPKEFIVSRFRELANVISPESFAPFVLLQQPFVLLKQKAFTIDHLNQLRFYFISCFETILRTFPDDISKVHVTAEKSINRHCKYFIRGTGLLFLVCLQETFLRC